MYQCGTPASSSTSSSFYSGNSTDWDYTRSFPSQYSSNINNCSIELHEESLTKIKITSDIIMEYYEFHKLLNEKLEEVVKAISEKKVKEEKQWKFFFFKKQTATASTIDV